MAFTQKAVDFLFENRLHDSRDWFREHRSEYNEHVIEPMSELIRTAAPVMAKIDPLIACDPARISRIYRDARYARDSVFRDHIWYTFSRTREQYHSLPGFYFSIGATGISYGCGYYCASSATMQSMREAILGGSPLFEKALAAYKKQKVFSLYGELYKRNKYPDQPPERQEWLNRKTIGLSFDCSDPAVMFSEGLAERVARDFKTIEPVYRFFMSIEE